jgi:hypothetical protein
VTLTLRSGYGTLPSITSTDTNQRGLTLDFLRDMKDMEDGQTGNPVSVTIVSASPRGQIDLDLMLQVEAMVYREGQPPYPAQIPLTVSQMQAPFVQPGRTFPGKADPSDRQKIWIDPASIH